MDRNKRLRLAQALKTKGEAAPKGAGDSTHPTSEPAPTSPTSRPQNIPNTTPDQSLPSPNATHPPSSPPPIAEVPLTMAGTTTTPAPLDKGKGVVVVPSQDDEDNEDGQVFKRRRTNKVVASPSSSSHDAESLREHPPSATPPSHQMVLEGRVEIETAQTTPAPAPELPRPIQELPRGYLHRVSSGGQSEEVKKEGMNYYLGAFLACANSWHDQARAKASELSALQALKKSVPP